MPIRFDGVPLPDPGLCIRRKWRWGNTAAQRCSSPPERAFPGLVTAGGTMEAAPTMLPLKVGGKSTCRFPLTDWRSKSSPLLPSLKNEDGLRVPGWFVHPVRHPEKLCPRVTPLRHSTDLKRGSLTSMLELAGSKVDEFVELFRGETDRLTEAGTVWQRFV